MSIKLFSRLVHEKAINDAADFLFNKHASVLDSYMLQSDNSGNVELPGEMEVNWKKTKIQIVAHGDPNAETVGGFPPDELADVVDMLTEKQGANKISIVSCISNSGDSNERPAYLEDFAKALKRRGLYSVEISAKSALVSVDSSGSKLTGEIVHSEYTPYS